MKVRLIWISAEHFTAGALYDGQTLVETAPILHYMRGWPSQKVKDYCAEKGWKLLISDPIDIESYEVRDYVWRDPLGNEYEPS